MVVKFKMSSQAELQRLKKKYHILKKKYDKLNRTYDGAMLVVEHVRGFYCMDNFRNCDRCNIWFEEDDNENSFDKDDPSCDIIDKKYKHKFSDYTIMCDECFDVYQNIKKKTIIRKFKLKLSHQ